MLEVKHCFLQYT